MATQVGPDVYGRSVMQTVSGSDAIYQVYTDFSNTVLALTLRLTNASLESALNIINSMSPPDYVPPLPPTTATLLTNLVQESPTRSLNVAFMPSAFYATFVYYTIQIDCTASLGVGQSGKVELLSDANPTPTTVKGFMYNAATVSIASTITNTHSAMVCCLVPAGHYVKLKTTGNANITLATQAEMVVSQ